MVCGGLYVLSTEFEVANRILKKTKVRFAAVLQYFGIEVESALTDPKSKNS